MTRLSATSRRTPLEAVARARYSLLIATSIVMVVAGSRRVTVDTDWQFFSWGSRVLFGDHSHAFVRATYRLLPTLPGGLHLYGNYPFLQIGPPALLVSRVIDALPGRGVTLAGVVVQLLGLAFVYGVDRAYRPASGLARRICVLLGGGLVLIVWGSLTYYRHLDDAMTLTATALAAWALTRGRFATTGALLGLAAASKPWGLPLLALALAPPTWRGRLVCGAAAALVAAAFWGPFVVVDADTLRLGQEGIQQSPDSALAALHLASLPTSEHLRLIQFGAGLLVAGAVVAAGSWPLAPLAAFSVRLLADPNSYPYYATAIVAAAFLADLGRPGSRLPWLTALATAGFVAAESTSGNASGDIRLATYSVLAVTAVALAVASMRRSSAASP